MKNTKKRGKKRRSFGAVGIASVVLLLFCAVLLAAAVQSAHLPKGSGEQKDFPDSASEQENTENRDETGTHGLSENDAEKGASDLPDSASRNEESGSDSAQKSADGTDDTRISSDHSEDNISDDAVTAGTVLPTDAAEVTGTGEASTVAKPMPEPVPVTGISLSTYSVSLTVGARKMPLVTMYPENASDKGEIWVSDHPEIASVSGYGTITANSVGTCTVTVTSRNNAQVTASVTVTVSEPIEPEVTYINGILIANKSYPLPSDYNPGNDKEAVDALKVMISAAAEDNITLWLRSGFRSYELQKTLYNGYVRRDGAAAADRYSARPGYSEHQTGLAFDLNSLSQSFADTPAGIWLAAHCSEYGFIIRYPKDKESITGYMYEPWHVRYLGIDTAKAVTESGLTLEEYLGITSVYADES